MSRAALRGMNPEMAKAITAGDKDMVAMLWRLDEIAGDDGYKPGILEELEPRDRWSALLNVVRPSKEIIDPDTGESFLERSKRVAEELISSPFALEGGQECKHCQGWFTPRLYWSKNGCWAQATGQKYCTPECQQAAAWKRDKRRYVSKGPVKRFEPDKALWDEWKNKKSGAKTTHCKNNHLRTVENTKLRRRSRREGHEGYLSATCMICFRASDSRSKAKRRKKRAEVCDTKSS